MTIIQVMNYRNSTSTDEEARMLRIPEELKHMDKDRRIRKICVINAGSITPNWFNIYYGSTLMGRCHVQENGAIYSPTNSMIRPHDSMLVCPAGQEIILKFPYVLSASTSFGIFIDQEEIV